MAATWLQMGAARGAAARSWFSPPHSDVPRRGCANAQRDRFMLEK
jgi:hypothetical protein